MGTFRFVDGGVYCLQQTVLGTGRFNGTRLGYAGYSYSAGGAAFDVRYPDLGTDGNAYKFQMVAPVNNPIVTTVAIFDKTSKTLRVMLRGTPGAITATATEVVTAINAMARPIYGAGLVTNAAIGAALVPTSLTGGLDPSVAAGYASPKLAPVTDIHAGMFYFDQRRAWRIQSVGGTFDVNTTAKISVVNVDKALRAISGSSMVLSSQALTTPWQLTGTRLGVPLLPGQALLVEASGAAGTVFVTATPVTGFAE